MNLQATAALVTLLLTSACHSTSAAQGPNASWVWIQTGPQDSSVLGDARNTAFAGHFSNMRMLSEQGELYVAGPLGESLGRPGHRGVFVLRETDPAAARAIADTDPTAQAGIFQFEIEPFHCADELERLPGWHAAALEAAENPNPPPGSYSRSYMLAEGSPVELAQSFSDAPGVLFAGRLGSGADQRVILCLDAEDDAQARTWLGMNNEVTWNLIPWYGTQGIERLRSED